MTDASDSVLRLASIALRRFTRDPETPVASSLNLLRCAVRLHALETSPADAALAAGEIVGELAIEARQQKKLRATTDIAASLCDSRSVATPSEAL